MRITWQTVRRNTNEILRVKRFTLKLVCTSWADRLYPMGLPLLIFYGGGVVWRILGGGVTWFSGEMEEKGKESTATEYKRGTIENWINNGWLLIFSNFLRIWVMSWGLSNMMGDSYIHIGGQMRRKWIDICFAYTISPLNEDSTKYPKGVANGGEGRSSWACDPFSSTHPPLIPQQLG